MGFVGEGKKNKQKLTKVHRSKGKYKAILVALNYIVNERLIKGFLFMNGKADYASGEHLLTSD